MVEHGVGIDAAATASGMTSITVRRLRKKARERGFDPEVSSVMKEEYVKDAPRSGHPPKVTSEVESDILTTVRKTQMVEKNQPQCLHMSTMSPQQLFFEF